MNITLETHDDAVLTDVTAEWFDREDNLPDRLVITCTPGHTQVSMRYAADQGDNVFLVRVWSGFLNTTIRVRPEGAEEQDKVFDCYLVPDVTRKDVGVLRILFLKNVLEGGEGGHSSSSGSG